MMAPVAGSGSCPACRQMVLKRAREVSFTGQYDITTFVVRRSPCCVRNEERRTKNDEAAGRRVLIAESRQHSAMRRYLLQSLPGKALIVGVALRVVVVIVGAVFGSVPQFLSIVNTVAGLAIAAGGAYFIFQLLVLAKRRLLWRVRRKLILSYMFVGFVPALLIVAFFLLCGFLLFYNFSSYLVQSRLRSLSDQARFLAQTTALEIQRSGVRDTSRIVVRRQTGAVEQYPGLSIAVVPV